MWFMKLFACGFSITIGLAGCRMFVPVEGAGEKARVIEDLEDFPALLNKTEGKKKQQRPFGQCYAHATIVLGHLKK